MWARTAPVLLVLAGLLGHVASDGTATAGQAPAPSQTASPTLSRPEMEAFLARARIVRRRTVGKGITGTIRATLSDGTLTHDASVQTVDISQQQYRGTRGMELNFRDTWRFNVAAYLLDTLLDLGMIPATVERLFDGREASFTWWVDDMQMDEGERRAKGVPPPDSLWWNEQMWIVRVFDQLIDNTDRNLGNLLITSTWRVWMIDHTRAFRRHHVLRAPENLGRCDRRLLAQLRALDRETLGRALGRYLGAPEIAGVLARRDLIVAHFERQGEAALYDARRLP
jgi:hypothetical protein